jgi:hypothetical protein
MKMTLKQRKMLLVISGFTEHPHGIGRCGNHWRHKNFSETRLSLKEAESFLNAVYMVDLLPVITRVRAL